MAAPPEVRARRRGSPHPSSLPPPQPSAVELLSRSIGALASSACATTALAPFTRVKLVLQTQGAHAAIRSGQLARYDGWRDAHTRLLATQGVLSLWRGNLATVLIAAPTFACGAIYSRLTAALVPRPRSIDSPPLFLASVFARVSLTLALTGLTVYPLEFLRTHMTAELGAPPPSYRQLITRTLGGPGGFLAFYAGASAGVTCPIAQSILFRVLSFLAYDLFKPDTRGHPVKKMAVSLLVSTPLAFALYPLDTVSQRLRLEAHLPREARLYTGVRHCAARIVKEEGWQGLWRGSAVTWVTVASSFAVVIADELARGTGLK